MTLTLLGTGFRVGLKPLAVLRPHERTIPRHVDKIAEEIKKDGIQKDPIIVDEETGAVLDGMHRLAAFKKLGLEVAVCCSVPYSSPAVALSRWARVYRATGSPEALSLMREAGIKKKVSLVDAFAGLEKKQFGVAAFAGGGAYVSDSAPELDTAFSTVDALDHASEAKGWERKFVAEDEADFEMQEPKNVVVLVRRITKDEVVSAAKTGKLFPCKTSMHSIDPRPVSIRFLVSDMEETRTMNFRELFDGKEAKILPPGSIYEGRRYKEKLLVLRQP